MAEDKRNVPYDAEWAGNLKHRPDPNRVSNLQTPVPGAFVPATGDERSSPPGAQYSRTALTPSVRPHDPQSVSTESSYYDIPILKQPVWKWEIASYFYLGGISAGAYLLGRVADRFGSAHHREAAQMASYVAMATLLPCPPLLIADLGDPKRFHHMLRVWKPGTPMNLGTWSILAYSGMAAYEAVRQYLQQHDGDLPASQRSKLLKLMNHGVLLAVHDAAGVPLALVVAGYTGVLLSCTANPLWSKNPWLGPLFSASAISTGAEAIRLAMDLAGKSDREAAQSQKVLQEIDSIAHAAEMACLNGFKKHAGEKATPARQGAMRKHHAVSVGGIIAAEVLKRLPVPGRFKKPLRILASALGLAAGFSLRWSMIFGGHAAAADPHLSRLASAPSKSSRARKKC